VGGERGSGGEGESGRGGEDQNADYRRGTCVWEREMTQVHIERKEKYNICDKCIENVYQNKSTPMWLYINAPWVYIYFFLNRKPKNRPQKIGRTSEDKETSDVLCVRFSYS